MVLLLEMPSCAVDGEICVCARFQARTLTTCGRSRSVQSAPSDCRWVTEDTEDPAKTIPQEEKDSVGPEVSLDRGLGQAIDRSVCVARAAARAAIAKLAARCRCGGPATSVGVNWDFEGVADEVGITLADLSHPT